MKTRIISFLFLLIPLFCLDSCKESYVYAPAPMPLQTRWAQDVTPGNAWPDYPRPQMERAEWLNLNGLWDFEISKKDDEETLFTRRILVPYPVESGLSGIGQMVGADSIVWYKRTVRIPSSWKNKDILLHFEASDWYTRVWVNGKPVGEHKGGYDPFSFNITHEVIPGKKCEILVSVWDPSNDGPQPRGKQVKEPKGIFYTPTSGIWQTVWMEPVDQTHLEDFRVITDIDRALVRINPIIAGDTEGLEVEATISGAGRDTIHEMISASGWSEIPVPDPHLWNPDDPFLYGLNLKLIRNGEILDEVHSYFGMRKISLGKDDKGFTRLMLNNEFVFQNGPLDQGFWPDGIYTPPTDEAMVYDLQAVKDMGFNMLRKHVKVENRRFYNWCDKMGILVWQDMPSTSGYVPPGKPDLDRPSEETQQFEQELVQMIKTKFNHPSIIMWVPFNEGWGQYNTAGIVDLVRSVDSTRLVNNTSGWQDRGVGDVIDLHHYPDPICPELEENRANVLGEFGGLGLYVEGHTWQEENWGYKKMGTKEDLLEQYRDFYDRIREMKDACGLSASIYTQITDVETETNGLMTYDRKVDKIGRSGLRKINRIR
ncbi:MAG: beta-galactosidase [Bacteroidetes bacterium]|nr:beta-galactosidase [Bacteroidota bacterium]